MLHLTNGDSAAGSLRKAGLPGDVIVWSDVLHEGPIPSEHGAVWRRTRAEFLSSAGYGTFDDVFACLERADATLGHYSDHDELVLWFEHDLFDQLLLARHLHWLGTQGHCHTQVSLVCIDRFPGIDRFAGLGQLTPSQLATLFPGRRPLSEADCRVAADVWRAFTDDDPRTLAVIANGGVSTFPFMAGALIRHLEEFPGHPDGLSRTERTVLAALIGGPRSPREVFLAVQEQEERVFMGDWTFWHIVRQMSRGPAPLVQLDVAPDRTPGLPAGSIEMTADGRRVLSDGVDAVTLRGIDRWLGGVHLTPDRLWRWDASARRLHSR